MTRRAGGTAACALAVASLVAAPTAGARAVSHPMQAVALRLAGFIRHDARRDRHAPGTLVRRSVHGRTETLAVYYAARPWVDAVRYWESPQYGGYELAVTDTGGVVGEVSLLAFRQLAVYHLGGKREELAGAEQSLTFRRERVDGEPRWNAARNSIEHRCLRPTPPGQPRPSNCGEGLGVDNVEGEPTTMLDLATALIAEARRHEPPA